MDDEPQFHSILFERDRDGLLDETREAPDCLADLNLDQVIDTITAGKQEYGLRPFFYSPLRDVEAIRYRHEVMRDLENRTLFEIVDAFAKQMRAMREHLAQAEKLHYPSQKKRWFLDAVDTYCDAVTGLARDLAGVALRSRGLAAFRVYLARYVGSGGFTALRDEAKQLLADLAAVRYCLLIKGNTIYVRPYASETDYSAEVDETFAKFKQGAVKDYRVKFSAGPDMNHVEAQVLDFVARLHPDVFSALDRFAANHHEFLDATLGRFDREIQFYTAYLDYVAIFTRAGLSFCYPEVSPLSKEIFDEAGFDAALAYTLIGERTAVVCNDFVLHGAERILVVSGPNQGGKTTFARMFGQLHYLASLGCPVPGKAARLFLFDRLFTHFDKEERLNNLRGKLEDDLVRISEILAHATPQSIIILNESFTATTLRDALFVSRKVMEKVLALDVLGVCVTFLDELASLSEKTVSMVSTVVPENPALRTYKIVRRPADGLAYALAIAEKYRLSSAQLKERIAA